MKKSNQTSVNVFLPFFLQALANKNKLLCICLSLLSFTAQASVVDACNPCGAKAMPASSAAALQGHTDAAADLSVSPVETEAAESKPRENNRENNVVSRPEFKGSALQAVGQEFSNRFMFMPFVVAASQTPFFGRKRKPAVVPVAKTAAEPVVAHRATDSSKQAALAAKYVDPQKVVVSVEKVVPVEKTPEQILGHRPPVYHVLMAQKCLSTSYPKAQSLYVLALRLTEDGRFAEAKQAEEAAKVAIQNMQKEIKEEAEKKAEKKALIKDIKSIITLYGYRSVEMKIYLDERTCNYESRHQCFYDEVFTKKELEDVLSRVTELKKLQDEKEALMKNIESIITPLEHCSKGMKNYLHQITCNNQSRLERFYQGIYPKEKLEDILKDVTRIKQEEVEIKCLIEQIEAIIGSHEERSPRMNTYLNRKCSNEENGKAGKTILDYLRHGDLTTNELLVVLKSVKKIHTQKKICFLIG